MPGPYPSADEIARRAHELFISNGRRITMIPEYWRAAERELLKRAADRVIGRADRRCHGGDSQRPNRR